jgi:hypothetical protein
MMYSWDWTPPTILKHTHDGLPGTGLPIGEVQEGRIGQERRGTSSSGFSTKDIANIKIHY